MAKNIRRIDERPSHGRRMDVDGTSIDDTEARGMAAVALTILASYGFDNNPEAVPERVKEQARAAAIAWVREFRRSTLFFRKL